MERGQKDYGNVPEPLVALQPPAHLEPVHAWHDNIEQNNVGIVFDGQFQTLRAAQGGDDAGARKRVRHDRFQDGQVVFVVIDR